MEWLNQKQRKSTEKCLHSPPRFPTKGKNVSNEVQRIPGFIHWPASEERDSSVKLPENSPLSSHPKGTHLYFLCCSLLLEPPWSVSPLLALLRLLQVTVPAVGGPRPSRGSTPTCRPGHRALHTSRTTAGSPGQRIPKRLDG